MHTFSRHWAGLERLSYIPYKCLVYYKLREPHYNKKHKKPELEKNRMR